MDKNTIIGLVLTGLIFIGFSIFNKPTPTTDAQPAKSVDTAVVAKNETKIAEAETIYADSLNANDSMNQIKQVPMYLQKAEEQIVTLKNNKLELQLTNHGGVPQQVQLFDYKAQEEKPLYLFKKGDLSINLPLRTKDNELLNTSDLFFTPINATDSSVTMRLNIDTESYLDLTYALYANDYRVKFSISGKNLNHLLPSNMSFQDLEWNQKLPQQELSWKFEDQYSGLMYRYTGGGIERYNTTKKDINESEGLRWVAFQGKFFSTVLINMGDALEANKMDVVQGTPESGYVKSIHLKTSLNWNVSDGEKSNLLLYFGPNDFNLLKSYDKGVDKKDRLELDHLVYMGVKIFRIINEYLIIPVVTFLKTYLSNWGLIILLLTIFIKLLLSPFTFKAYYSQAKMRVLKPQIDAINEKYPGNDRNVMMKRQTEVMSLYRSAGASPTSGCLPLLLQMPFLIALYMYFPCSIDLRGQSFLWAHDLSAFDPIVSWNTHIPIISSLIGNHISLFCLLMTISNLLLNKMMMQQSNNSAPGAEGMAKMMKTMPYIMTVFLFFFFNQNASGLCYYYMLVAIITVIQNYLFKLSINEQKLLDKLEENKRKPQKKSKWLQRLEEAQKYQQEMQRQKNKRH